MSKVTELTTYDAVPYPPYSFPATSIGRLAAIGRVFSLPTADPRNARVLELGCSSGVNTLAMAQLYPEAEFVGVDLSNRQIQLAEEALAATGLKNVRFIQGNISDLGKDLGKFDYIITHGIYSWVPANVKDDILRLSHDLLKPEGVAYISYNCLPGWRMRGALRDMMQMHTATIKELPAKVAQGKALIKFLAESCTEDTPYGKYLRQELELLRTTDDSYIAHEFFEEDNEAYYFMDFLKAAAQHKMAYLGDAEPATMVVDNLPTQAAQTLKSLNLNLLATEQYMDFVRNRQFRSTLLCHASAPLSRNVDPKTIDGLNVISLVGVKRPLSESEPALFVAANGTELTVNEPFTAELFSRIAASGRSSCSCNEVIDETMQALSGKLEGKDPEAVRNDLGRILLQGYFRRMVDLTVGSVGVPAGVESDKPEVLPLARWQASKGLRVSSHRLDMLNTDPFVGKFISLCDGTRDRTALIDAMTEAVNNKEFQLNENNQLVEDPERARFIIEKLYDGSVNNLRQLGILVASVGNGYHN
jgi:methyltransferase-like protein/2-polyprenyl-3-methyl-5-hydroxy-6-metoxy-1,4-benzoquinol methylase